MEGMNKERNARILSVGSFVAIAAALVALSFVGYKTQQAYLYHLNDERLGEGQSLGVALPSGVAVLRPRRRTALVRTIRP